MLALHKPDVYLIKPVPRSGLGLPPRPAPSEILAPPPPPPECRRGPRCRTATTPHSRQRPSARW